LNPIESTFNEIVTTQRLEPESGSDIEEYENYIVSLNCHIQPLDQYEGEDEPGTFAKTFMMYCLVEDIKEGDRIIRADGTGARVIGVKKYSFIGYQHMEIAIRSYE
jgi:hypothetical protein